MLGNPNIGMKKVPERGPSVYLIHPLVDKLRNLACYCELKLIFCDVLQPSLQSINSSKPFEALSRLTIYLVFRLTCDS